MSFVIVAPELMEAGHRTCPAARSHSPRSPDQLRTGQLPNSRLDSAHSVRFPILAADRPGTRCLKTRCWKSAERQKRAKQRELRIGDVDRAVEKSRIVFNYLLDMGGMLFRGPAITVLVEALLARGGKGDFPEAPSRGSCCTNCRCCGSRLYRLGCKVTTPPTRTSGIATARWRKVLASRGISRGPRRCHDGGCPFKGGDVFVQRR